MNISLTHSLTYLYRAFTARSHQPLPSDSLAENTGNVPCRPCRCAGDRGAAARSQQIKKWRGWPRERFWKRNAALWVLCLLLVAAAGGLAVPMPVLAQPTYIYWATGDLGEVRRALTACPTSSAELLVSSLNYPGYIALDTSAGRMFVSEVGNDSNPDRIIRCSLSDCSGTVTPVVTGLNNPEGLALDTSAQLIYWAEQDGSVKRADALGTNSNVGVIASGLGTGLADLELASGKLYWADEDNQTIWRADAALGATPEAIVTGISASQLGPIGIAVDLTNGKVYWSEVSTQKVYRADICAGGGCPVNCAPSSSGCEAIFTEPLGHIYEVDLDLPGGKVWWSTRSSGSIRYGALDDIPLSDQTAYTLIGTGGLVQGIALSNEVAGACPPCAAVPLPGCRTAGRFGINIRKDLVTSKNRLTWNWTAGQKTDRVEFGNPFTGSTNYTLCVYDEPAGQASLKMSATVPPAGTCAGKPCWKETLGGFKYRDPNLTAAGISTISLKAGQEGRAKISVKGKGGNLPLPSAVAGDKYFGQNTEVTVQLIGSGLAACWGAEYSQPANKNTVDRFKDRQP